MTTDEKWLPVVGLEGWYEVSNGGRIRRSSRGKRTRVGYVLRPRLTRKGYQRICLTVDGERHHCFVHVLVAEAFVGPRDGKQVNHINGDKSDNAVSNLEYTTGDGNIRHALESDLYPAGERAKAAKLRAADVIRWRALPSMSWGEMVAEAQRLGVAPLTVYRARTGATWNRKFSLREAGA